MSDVCPNCGKVHGKRVNTGIIVTKDELESLKLIMGRFECLNQINSDLMKQFSVDTGQEVIDKIISSIVNKKAEIRYLEQDWWDTIMKKYQLAGEINIDFVDGQLHYFETK